MSRCTAYDHHEIGTRYASLGHRDLLMAEESCLSAEDRALRQALVAFEEHLFECGECLARLKAERALAGGFGRLGGDARGRAFLENLVASAGAEARRRTSPRWLGVAMSLLLATAVVLALWVVSLRARLRTAGSAAGPEAIRVFVLDGGELSGLRQATPDPLPLPPDAQAAVVAANVPFTDASQFRIEGRLLGKDAEARWADDDVRIDRSGWLYILLPRALLAARGGSLHVRVLGREDGTEKARAVFPLELLH